MKYIHPFLFALLAGTLACTIPRNAASESGMSYLALGDSYTIGESVEESERYPNQLAAALRKEKIGVADPLIVAKTGWTTGDLQRGIASTDIPAKTYELVTLLIGVNNEFQGRSEEEYAAGFTALLEQSVQFAGGKKERVFVLSIPDYGYTPYGEARQERISERIDRFNAINRRIADSSGVVYVDVTPVSRKGLSDPALVAHDGLHPSGKQYGEWVKLLAGEVKKGIRP